MQALARQIKALATAPPEGIKYVPTESISEVLCDMDGPTGTPYEGGTFKVKLVLGQDYPTAPPKGACQRVEGGGEGRGCDTQERRRRTAERLASAASAPRIVHGVDIGSTEKAAAAGC